jgi:hypothetical protein
MLPESFLDDIGIFASCFTHPSFDRFVTMVTGWTLCVGKHTVTGVLRAAGVVGFEHHSGYHRFFARAAWSRDRVGLTLLGLVPDVAPMAEVVELIVDDTLARHTGKHIAAGCMHRDPLLSTSKKPMFHFGHNWVVLALAIRFRGKVFALPVLVRLYRSKKLNKKLGRPHRKKTELANELIQLVAAEFPERQFRLIGDNAWANCSILRPLPSSFHFVGRARLDASLNALPPARQGRGRPRIKGRKLASPNKRGHHPWRKLKVEISGRPATVRVQVFDALWYRVARGRQLRFVLVRGWPGHSKDDVLVTTDLTMTAKEIICNYCSRWAIEETFGWVKSRLGFEDPQNRTEPAAERTEPMALWTYSLVFLWYRQWSKGRSHLPFREAPWYTTKTMPSFADMLATLRRQSWTLWISDQVVNDRLDQKDLAPVLDLVGYG